MQRTAWPRLDGLELGLGLRALRKAERAALGEAAAGRAAARPRRLARDRRQHARLGDHRDRPDQTARVRVQRALEHARRPELDRAPGVQHEHAIGDLPDHREVVRDVDHRRLVLLAQVTDGSQDVGLGGHVEPGGRLVHDDRLRPEDRRHRDRDALLLAARELMGVAAQELGVARQADVRERLADRVLHGSVAELARVDLEHLAQLPPDPQRRVQRGGRVLGHVGHVLAAAGAELRGTEAEHRPRVDRHLAGGDPARRPACRRRRRARRSSCRSPTRRPARAPRPERPRTRRRERSRCRSSRPIPTDP